MEFALKMLYLIKSILTGVPDFSSQVCVCVYIQNKYLYETQLIILISYACLN